MTKNTASGETALEANAQQARSLSTYITSPL
jgi:hypothetical protein